LSWRDYIILDLLARRSLHLANYDTTEMEPSRNLPGICLQSSRTFVTMQCGWAARTQAGEYGVDNVFDAPLDAAVTITGSGTRVR
jgi:hypothetical protein